MKTPRFIYFDLGNVLLFFDHARGCRQLAEAVVVPSAQIREFFAQEGLLQKLETGRMTTEEVHAQFCQTFGVQVELTRWVSAACDIFSINRSVVPLITRLYDAGTRLGILSNTSAAHWNWVGQGRFRLIRDLFEIQLTSYRLGAMKPAPEVYLAATELAKVPADEIFFTDDREENVVGASLAGWQAVQFQSAAQIAGELQRRGHSFFF